MKLSRSQYRIAYGLLIPAAALLVIGLMFVHSASAGYARTYLPRQATWVLVGVLLAVPLALTNYREYRNYALPLFVAAVLGLAAVLLVGREVNGARSWLGFGGLGIQPSEFAKLAVILMFGRYLADFEEHRYDPVYFLISFIILFIPLVLILLQPDLGTALVFVPVVLAMFYVSGTRQGLMAIILVGGMSCLPLLWRFLSIRQKQRILLTWSPEQDPWHYGYQAIQSRIAVGSGLLSGRGFMQSIQSKLNFLPERHTDFIFSVIGEEWGFIGGLAVILLYFWLVMAGLAIARRARDVFGEVVAVGIAALFATHIIMNVGMAIGLLPIIGLPLPLLSYGGSSLLTSCVAIGILQSIYARSTA
jgi:rod shape determining protein RodA